MPIGVQGILNTNRNIQNTGNPSPYQNSKNDMSASIVKGKYNYHELFKEDNEMCGAFEESSVDKQILMMTTNCTSLEQAQ